MLLGLVVVAAMVACGSGEETSTSGALDATSSEVSVDTSAPTATTAAPAAEKSGELHGTIVSRDAAKNTVTLQHEKVEGIMDAMTMPFELRDGKVDSLPPDGTHVVATLHEQNGQYWVTAVREMK
jgi:Cu/Ag efflux protein CusF